MKCTLSYDSFEAYVLYKAFDFISDGAYKKLLVKCKDNGDVWAISTYSKIQETTLTVRQVVQNVQNLHEYGKPRLHKVCLEVMSSANPPCKKKAGWNTCVVTGTRSDECIDLTRPGRSESLVTIHPKFSHFMVMLWLIAKIEHVCKVYTKHWLTAQGSAYQEEKTVQDICNDFQAQNDTIEAMYAAFSHGVVHVTNSIETYKNTEEFELYSRKRGDSKSQQP
jgi:hypothetical protein